MSEFSEFGYTSSNGYRAGTLTVHTNMSYLAFSSIKFVFLYGNFVIVGRTKTVYLKCIEECI